MASAKKDLSRNTRNTRTVRNADDGRMLPPLPGERARVGASVKQCEEWRIPDPTQLVPALLLWFATKARNLPWRRTRDPYAIWVSEIMLQQTQVKTVIPYWERWMHELPTIRAAAKTSAAKLHKLWEGLGYYTRVRNLQKAAQQIIAQHNGEFPENFDDILALPGIGRYTAGAIASIAFNQPHPILDGNVIRVLTRIFGVATNPREKKTNARLWRIAGELVQYASRVTQHTSPCSRLNQSLMELGALVCTPRSPRCGTCPINSFCVANLRGWQEKLPKIGERQKPTARRFLAFVVERNGSFLVRQRPAGSVNAYLWEFPNLEAGDGATPRKLARTSLGQSPVKLVAIGIIKHSITRYRITLEAYRAELPNSHSTLDGQWLPLSNLQRLAFTSAHKTILGQLAKNR